MDQTKLIKVINTYYQEKEDRAFPDIQSGLVLELEDGRLLTHSQDGYVIPFSVSDTLTTELNREKL